MKINVNINRLSKYIGSCVYDVVIAKFHSKKKHKSASVSEIKRYKLGYLKCLR